jgi:muramidase (phage lysozyme)
VTRDDLLHAIQDPNLLAFLHVIREGETNQTDDAYRELFGGELFDYFGDHPRKLITKTLGGKEITSSAAGAYQFIRSTWDGLVRQYGFKDFSPINQDLGAVALIAEKKALPLITEGRIREAIARCASVWASLPGSQYGQPTQKLEKALAVYREYGGSLVAEAPTSPAVPASTKEVTPWLLSSSHSAPLLIDYHPLGKLEHLQTRAAKSHKGTSLRLRWSPMQW